MRIDKDKVKGFIKRERQIREAIKARYAIIVKKSNGRLYFVWTSADSQYECKCRLENRVARNLHRGRPDLEKEVGSKAQPVGRCSCPETGGRVKTYNYWWINRVVETPLELMLKGQGYFTKSYCYPVPQEPTDGVDVTEDYFDFESKKSTFTNTPQKGVREEEARVKVAQDLFKKVGF